MIILFHDERYGALIRIQELCQLAAFPPQQVVLYHCEVAEGSGLIVPLPPPKASCKHASTPRVHIQELPLIVSADNSRSEEDNDQHSNVSASGRGLLNASFDLILCVRFLHRAFNDRVPTLLSQGGYILYNTFMDLEGTR